MVLDRTLPKITTALFVLASGIAATVPAGAVPVTFQMVNTVVSSTVLGVGVGDHLITTVSLDTATPDLNPDDPYRGHFLVTGQQPSWTVANQNDPGVALVDLFAFIADTLAFRQDQMADEMFLGTADQNGVPRFRMHLRFPGLTFANDGLPTSASDLGRLVADASSYELVLPGGTIAADDFVTLSPVSEPPELLLFGASLVVFGLLRRRADIGRTR